MAYTLPLRAIFTSLEGAQEHADCLSLSPGLRVWFPWEGEAPESITYNAGTVRDGRTGALLDPSEVNEALTIHPDVEPF
jgi:hypothetical protein